MNNVRLAAVTAFTTLVLVAPVARGAISEKEREAAVAYLEETRDTFRSLVEGIDEEQFNYHVTPESWSIADIAEHLVKVENVAFDGITNQLLAAPARPEWLSEGKPLLRDDIIRMAVTNREARKFTAPKFVSPEGRPTSRADAIREFVDARNRTIELARTTDTDLRSHFLANPAFGMLDGYQWLLFVAGHSERHTIQAREVMANASFPGTLHPISKEERAFLVDELHRSEDELEQLLRGLTNEQLTFRSAEDRWTIAEVVEHLARAEQLIFSVAEATVRGEARPDLKNADGGPRVKDLVYIMAMTNRRKKRFQAPERIQPTGEFSSADEALDAFRARRAGTIDYALTTTVDLRAYFRENPGFGQMDAYQWLLLLSMHTDRHALQIEEVKSSPGYPK